MNVYIYLLVTLCKTGTECKLEDKSLINVVLKTGAVITEI